MIRPPRYSLFIPLGETLGTDLMERRGGEGEHQGIKTRTMKEKGLQELIEQTFDRLSCPFRSQGVYTEIYQAMIRAFELGQEITGNRKPTRVLPWETLSTPGAAPPIPSGSPRPPSPWTPHKELSDPGLEEQSVWAAWVDEISDGEPRI